MITDTDQVDVNDQVDSDDNPITAEPGSLDARLQWNDVWDKAHNADSVAQGKALHPDAVGIYKGKALVPGIGENQGDLNLFRDKLIYSKGLSQNVASRIIDKYLSQFA